MCGCYEVYFHYRRRVCSFILCVFSLQDVWLQERRAEREKEFVAFMRGIEDQKSRIDREKEDEMRRIQAYYKDLQEKLKMKR